MASGRSATRNLTRVGLVLAPRRARGRRLTCSALLGGLLAAGVAIGYAGRMAAPGPAIVDPATASTASEIVQLRRQLEQAHLAQRLGDARSVEFEHQIDALNQRLRDAQEELTFFRQARAGKH
ncbi:MAG: hypothetical protein ACREXI_05730 [Caldimonas sp.]